MPKPDARCRWTTLTEALSGFAHPAGRTQSQAHIRPLHWYVACRLVVEGGYLPDEITPRPPFEVEQRRAELLLRHVPELGGSGERTVLGGLKTKDIDVTAVKPEVGPCLAVSIKGTLNAFRNLTNRMEEAVGDCTNLHIAYPNLVYGFLHVLRANREGPRGAEETEILRANPDGGVASNDIAIRSDERVADSIERYHDVLLGLAGRRGIRNDITRYESLALALVRTGPPSIMKEWRPAESPLRFERAFDRVAPQDPHRASELRTAAGVRDSRWPPARPAEGITVLPEASRAGRPPLRPVAPR